MERGRDRHKQRSLRTLKSISVRMKVKMPRQKTSAKAIRDYSCQKGEQKSHFLLFYSTYNKKHCLCEVLLLPEEEQHSNADAKHDHTRDRCEPPSTKRQGREHENEGGKCEDSINENKTEH